jgi:hypothetical protein
MRSDRGVAQVDSVRRVGGRNPRLMSRCKTCGAEIFWVTMDGTGKKMPIDAHPNPMVLVVSPDKTRARFVDSWTSHFVTCPQADMHRKVIDMSNVLTPEEEDDEANP